MRNESKAYDLWDKAGFPYYQLKTPRKLLPGSIFKLAFLLRGQKVDIVEIYVLRANIIARLAAKLAGVPLAPIAVLNIDDWPKMVPRLAGSSKKLSGQRVDS